MSAIHENIDITADQPPTTPATDIYIESFTRWTRLIRLLTALFPNIQQIMTIRNTNTDPKFTEIWTQMRGLYLKAADSTEFVSWETFKNYLEQNISSIPYLGVEDILTVMSGATQLKHSTNHAENLNHSSPSQLTKKRTAEETTFMSYTPVPFQIEAVAADSLATILEGPSNVFDGGMSRSPTSEISCSTSIHGPESTLTYTYPEHQGKYYIQMKIFKYADVLTAPAEKLWTKALQVLTFVTKNSRHKDIHFQDMKFVVSDRAEDPITKCTMELVAAVQRYSREHPKAVQATKRKRFTNW